MVDEVTYTQGELDNAISDAVADAVKEAKKEAYEEVYSHIDTYLDSLRALDFMQLTFQDILNEIENVG